MSMGATDFQHDVIVAVERYFGERPLRVTPLHPQVRLSRPCASFRIEMAAGHVLKARRMESAGAAEEQQRLRQGLPSAFASVLARDEAVLLESWVAGQALTEVPQDERLIGLAAGVLATLHRHPAAAGIPLPYRAPIQMLKNKVLAGLRALAGDAALPMPVAQRLIALAEASIPTSSAHCLIHTDFCGENLVLAADGKLFVIDNEHFRIDPPAMDLARTWYRWGWHDEERFPWQWQAFLAAYQAAGGDPAEEARHLFWRIAAVTFSACLRASLGDPHVPLHCLHQLADRADI